MRFILGVVVVLCAMMTSPCAGANSPDPLFQADTPLSVVITAPMGRVIRERSKQEELPGAFSYRNSDGTWVELDVQVRARGKFRHANCDFPLLNLNFRRSQVEGTLFDRQNKLKMVTHCKISARYEESVLREYLAYRMLNSVTDRSFRVRLLQVTYEDSEGGGSRMVRSGFLIEHENRLGDRLGLGKLNIQPDGIGALQADHLNLTSIFQYLLGNTDFSPVLGSNDECCHNVALFGKDGDPLVGIPYDFDMSGFVNTPYAMPDDGLGLENVRQRLYQGFCANNRYVEASVSEFLESRDTLYALVAGRRELGSAARQSLTEYLDEFYEVIGDPSNVEREITGRCLTDSS